VQYRLQNEIRRGNPARTLGFSLGSLGNRWLEKPLRLSVVCATARPCACLGRARCLLFKNSWKPNQLNEANPGTHGLQCRGSGESAVVRADALLKSSSALSPRTRRASPDRFTKKKVTNRARHLWLVASLGP